MKITDYVIMLARTKLPLDIIRIIISYVQVPLMKYITQIYLDSIMDNIVNNNKLNFRLDELPYNVYSISEIHSHLNNYILKHNMLIKFSHFSYKKDGMRYIVFYYHEDSMKIY